MTSKLKAGKAAYAAIIFLFIILFIYGISNTKEYGRSWDEPYAVFILESNWVEYAQRLFPEGSAPRNWADEPGIIPISVNFEKDHGCAPYYAFIPLYKMFHDDKAALVYAWHSYTFCLFFLSVIVVFFLLYEIYGSFPISVAGMLFYFFTPRFFGEGHFNDKDIVFMGLVMTCMLFAIRAAKKLALRKNARADIIFFCMASGFMMNVKIIGIAIWGLTGIFTIVYLLTRQEKKNPKAIVNIIIAVILSLLFYILLTPASWAGVTDFFKYLFHNAVHYEEWDSSLRFRGTLFRPAEIGMPMSYLPIWMLITIPVYITVLFISSVIVFVIRSIREKGKNLLKENSDLFFLMLLIGFSAPFCFVVLKSHSMILYNSWRHLYFLYAFMLPGTLYLPHLLINKYLNDHSRKNKAILVFVSAFTAISFLFCAGEMILNRSYEYVYYNALSRQITDVNGYEGDYWMVSVIPAINEFADIYYDGGRPLKVGCLLFEVHGIEDGMFDDKKVVITSPEDADYLVFNPSGSYDWLEIDDHEKLFSINRFGVELSGIYAK